MYKRTLSFLFFLCTLTTAYAECLSAKIETGYTQKFSLYSQLKIKTITRTICMGLVIYITGYCFWNYYFKIKQCKPSFNKNPSIKQINNVKIKKCKLCLNYGPSKNQNTICNNGHKLCLECVSTLKTMIATQNNTLLDESFLVDPNNYIPKELMDEQLANRDYLNKLKQCPFGPGYCNRPLILE